ncbi:hypothetical protein RRF57_009407 [Xylaria bambusicola]|uniref:Uncharacterized protein n=1 Tax=Xylaria bambusicola TaxID=326684 RepID=A0AAN7UUX8_9PEZI
MTNVFVTWPEVAMSRYDQDLIMTNITAGWIICPAQYRRWRVRVQNFLVCVQANAVIEIGVRDEQTAVGNALVGIHNVLAKAKPFFNDEKPTLAVYYKVAGAL